jgi:hypothetical protein
MYDEDLHGSKLVRRIEENVRNSFHYVVYNNVDGSNGIYLQDERGIILDKEDVESLIKGLNMFYEQYTQKEIDDENEERREEKRQEAKEFNEKCKQDRGTRCVTFRKQHSGYIYFVTTNDIEYKIGMAKDIKARMGEYTQLPYEPKLVHLIESKDYVLTEELFHSLYKDKRLRGEWFKLSLEDIEYIKLGKYSHKIMNSIGGI